MIAVVLAGGASRRFGTDKLAAPLGRSTLLEATLAGLPPECLIIVVGPPRPLARAVRFVREDPPGGGPAAALVAGLRAVLAGVVRAGDPIVVLPGDAPRAGTAAVLLAAELRARPDRTAVVGVDDDGRVQPLQLALSPPAARRLVEAAGPDGAAGGSARRLIGFLRPELHHAVLPAALCADVDTPADLAVQQASEEELDKANDA